jgi:chitinase
MHLKNPVIKFLSMKHCISILVLLACISHAYSQSKRVVGYLPSYHFAAGNEIEFCKLTHVNLAFANPDASGNLVMDDISAVLPLIYSGNPDMQIFLSIGGGQLDATLSQYWSERIDAQPNRADFVSQIVNYVVTQNLAGVDVDLEWDNVTSGYSAFVIELDAALTANNKQLSAALPNDVLFSNITPEALNAFDFINIMAYDATGPWEPSNVGQHSSYAFAESGISFWTQTAQLAPDKITLGVPFYGYDFVDNNTVHEFTYADIVQLDPANADADQVGNAFYNGRNLINQKTALAMTQTGGIMIWDLGEDRFDQYSLLTTIHDKINLMNISTSGLCGNTLNLEEYARTQPKLFPNPFTDQLNISIGAVRFVLVSISGEILKTGDTLDGVILLNDLSPGYYLLRIGGKSYPVIKNE